MDERANKGIASLSGVTRQGFCLHCRNGNPQPKSHFHPIETGRIRVIAVNNSLDEDREQEQSNISDVGSTNGESVYQKSPATDSRWVSSSSWKKNHLIQQSSYVSGKWSPACNCSAGSGLSEQSGSTSSSLRLGLSERPDLTALERLTSNFDSLRETPTYLTRTTSHRNSSDKRGEPGVYSNTMPNWQDNHKYLDLLHMNNRLTDLILENDEHYIQSGREKHVATNLRVDPSPSSMATVLNDARNQSNLYGIEEYEANSDNSFVTDVSMAEDLYGRDAASRSASVYPSTLMVDSKHQQQASVERGTVGYADNYPVNLGQNMIARYPASDWDSFTAGTANQYVRQSSPQNIFSPGSGSSKRYAWSSSLGIGASRWNLGSFGCTPVSETSFSSSIGQMSEQFHNGVPGLARRVIDGQSAAREQGLANCSVASNRPGTVLQKRVLSGVVRVTHHQESKTSLPHAQTSRRKNCSVHPGTSCSAGLLGGCDGVELKHAFESSSSRMCVADESSTSGNILKHRTAPLREENAIERLQGRNNAFFQPSHTLGDRQSNMHAWSSNRRMQVSESCGRFLGSAGPDCSFKTTYADTASASYSLLSKNNMRNSTSVITSPMPARAPPLLPVPQFSLQQTKNAFVSLPLSVPPPRRPPPPLSSSIAVTLSLADDTSTLDFSSNSLVVDGPISIRNGLLQRPVALSLEGVPQRSLQTLPPDSEGQSRNTIGGLEEVLLALEQIEQDEELTNEQVSMLEATLSFGVLSLQDRHSELRLDIDNMTYEELLALEERIGNVRIGLTKETISKCLNKRLYCSAAETEVKCSICQEEYEERDELGSLECSHFFHAGCIRQWLLQKNQCPICKASASL